MKTLTSPRSQLLLMILASAAVFMDYLDTSIVSVALPAISQSTGMSNSGSSWVMISYLLALGGTLLLFGKTADKTGRHKLIFISGFILFSVSSIFCAVAGDAVMLISFRVLQGVAAAAMVSTSTMLITLHLPEEKQGFATGVIATMGGVALALGPFVGGMLTEYLSWQWIFYINIPVGIVGTILAAVLIPKYEKPAEVEQKKPFDILGAVLLATSLVALIAGFELGTSEGWTLQITLVTIASPVLAVIFFMRELKHPDPVMSTKLLLNRTIMFSSLCILAISLIYIGMIYIMPFYLIDSLGFSAAFAGSVMLLPPVFTALIGIPAGALTKRFGCQKLCNLAGMTITFGIILTAVSIFISSVPVLLVAIAMTGLGHGLNEAPGIRRINIHSPTNLQGSSGGLVFTMMNIGCVLGVALFSSVASVFSNGTDFTSLGVAASCVAAAAIGVVAYISSKLAKDSVRC